MDGRKTDEEEGETEENPWRREDVDGWFEPEQGVPHGRGSEEDRSEDVQLNIVRPIATGKEGNLEAGCAEHLAKSNNDGVQWPPSDFAGHGNLETGHWNGVRLVMIVESWVIFAVE